jgi:hypothetical protein
MAILTWVVGTYHTGFSFFYLAKFCQKEKFQISNFENQVILEFYNRQKLEGKKKRVNKSHQISILGF